MAQGDRISLAEAIRTIEKREKVTFFYKKEFITGLEVPASVLNIPLEDFLRNELAVIDIGYLRYFDRSYIFLFKGKAPSVDLLTARVIDSVQIPRREVNANTQYHIAGGVRDAISGENISGASIFVEETATGTVSDVDGHFSLTLSAGVYRIRVTSVGKAPTSQRILLYEDRQIEFEMFEQNIQLEDVVVLSHGTDRNVSSTEMGQVKMDIRTLRSIPPFMGEVDIIKSIQLLPGVSTVGEGSSGFNVRGGNVDQNLIMLDDTPLLNSSHLFGFFSTFNPDFVKEVTLYKGFMPANYGGRVSSVLDVRMRDGNKTKLSGSGGLGIISSRFLLEGPIGKGKTSFIVGGRYAYPNWLLKKIPDLNVQRSSTYFYDLNLRIHHQINDKNSLDLSAYRSEDDFKFAADTTYGWNTTNLSLRWNAVISPRLYANFIGLFSNYETSISGLSSDKGFDANFGVNMRGGKADITYVMNGQNRIDFGAAITDYTFNNGTLTPGTNSSINQIRVPEEYSREMGIYVSDELKISQTVSVNAGIRYSMYNVYGAADVFLYKDGIPKDPATVTSILHFAKGERIKQYSGWEPRFLAKVSINEKSSLKFSYNRNYQYLQLISNTTAISPLDLWKTSNYYIKPQIGDQFAIGYFRNLRQNNYELSVEGYYKEIQNLVEYKDGANLFMNQYLESQLLNAHGVTYGLELLLKKKEGKLTGWLSYTFSRSFRQTKGNTPEETINSGNMYPSNFDKPHYFVTVANYAFTKRIGLSANFTYSTGRPTTYPQGVYLIDGYSALQFSERNQARIPDYHRLDLSFTIEQTLNRTKKWKGSWVFSVYNVYGRANAYSIFLRPQYKGFQTQSYRLAVVGTVFPSITYNFKF